MSESMGRPLRFAGDAEYVVQAGNGVTLCFVVADIVQLPVDIIVSSDDTELSMGGGVSAAIRRAAGEAVFDRVDALTRRPLPPGQRVPLARVIESRGGRLPARKVYQVPVVDWAHEIGATQESVKAAALACLRLARTEPADDHHLGTSIALPLLGTGAGGLSTVEALAAVTTAAYEVRELPGTPLEVVVSVFGNAGPTAEWVGVIKGLAAGMALRSAPTPTSAPVSLPQSDDLRSLALKAPAPVALPAFQSANQVTALDRLRFAIDACEATVRLAVALTQEANGSTRFQRLEATALRVGNRPTLGRWIAAFRDGFASLIDIAPSFASAFRTKSKWTDGGDFYLNRLSSIRNQEIGHGSPMPDEGYERSEAEVSGALRASLVALVEQRLRLVTPVDFDWAEGDSIMYILRDLEGPYAAFPTRTEEVSGDLRLRRNHVYVHDIHTGGWRDLDPLLIYAMCPRCQKDDVFFLETIEDHVRVEYRSFLTDHKRDERISA